jgi:hypothetical protein
MPRLALIKALFFRLAACVLLAVSVGFVVVPEPTVYSTGRTFIKSHIPSADSYMLVLNSDDREDLDEDGYIDVQVSPLYFEGLITFVSFGNDKTLTKPTERVNNVRETYIIHRQLLI